MGRGSAAVLVAALVCAGSPAGAFEAQEEPEVAIGQATFTLLPPRCAGVIVATPSHGLTAAHCLEEGEDEVRVELYDGTQLDATAVLVDRDQDVAILEFDEPAGVEPLRVAETLPQEGEGVWFSGRNDRPGEIQLAEIDRLAPCPSLPRVPVALHTTLRGTPGDSGAPVVDLGLQVVGLVHGGAACSIAAPTAPIAAELNRIVYGGGRNR